MSKSIVEKSLSLPDNTDAILQRFTHRPVKSKSNLIFNLPRRSLSNTSSWNRSEWRTYHKVSGQNSFGGTGVWELEENFMLIEPWLEVEFEPLTQTGGTQQFYHRTALLIDTITLFSGGGSHQLKQIEGSDLFFSILFSHTNDALATINSFSGLGSDVERSQNNTDGKLRYFIPLKSVFFNTNIPMWHLKGKLRLVIKWKDGSVARYGDGTSPSTPAIKQCLLHCHYMDYNRSIRQALVANKNIKHYRVVSSHRTKLHIPSGSLSFSDQYLNFSHPSVFLLFYITKVNAEGQDVIDNNIPIKQFVLKDQNGTIISYASPIDGEFCRTVLAYTQWDNYLRNSPFLDVNNLYFFSFAQNPAVSLLTGNNTGWRRLYSNERISIDFSQATAEDYTLHLISYAYEMLQLNPANGSLVVLT